MSTLRQSNVSTRPGSTKLLLILLLAQFVGIGGLLPYYTFTRQEGLGLRIFAVGLVFFAVFTMAGVWFQKPWAMWAVLTLVSFKLTLDLFNYALGLDRLLLPLSELINGGIILIAFRQVIPGSATLTAPQKIFFAFVLALAALVGFWGLFVPARADMALPFLVPPLHARFLGAMYASGVTFMLLSMIAKNWAEVRVVAPMISIWTGMLGLVSLFHLDAFDWSRTQVWVWFVAYIGYPLIAAWIAWQQRSQREHLAGPPLAAMLRSYLYLQGGIVTILALSLLLFPTLMTTLWPWNITPVLAHIYSAPFLSYGLGSLYATRQQTWAEVRIVIYATLVFTLGVLIASLLHADLFDFGTVSAWLWFGGFALATLMLALFGSVPALRGKSAATLSQT
jgi:hypothetical protein